MSGKDFCINNIHAAKSKRDITELILDLRDSVGFWISEKSQRPLRHTIGDPTEDQIGFAGIGRDASLPSEKIIIKKNRRIDIRGADFGLTLGAEILILNNVKIKI